MGIFKYFTSNVGNTIEYKNKKREKLLDIRDAINIKSELNKLYREVEIETPRKTRDMFYFHNLIKDWQYLAQILSSAITSTSQALG